MVLFSTKVRSPGVASVENETRQGGEPGVAEQGGRGLQWWASGISGLTAAYVLQQRYDVTLYESAGRLGGHADTHDVVTPDAGTVPIDTGFIVHNPRTYPLLCRLFSELNVETRPTEMSMSIRCEGCGLEYAGGKGFGGVVRPTPIPRQSRFPAPAQPRFDGFIGKLVVSSPRVTMRARWGSSWSGGRYSRYFSSHFVVPIVSCVWSVAPGMALQYPARYLFTFLENHGMLSLAGSPTWRTVVGGSRTYVDRVVKDLNAVATSTPVRAVIAQS